MRFLLLFLFATFAVPATAQSPQQCGLRAQYFVLGSRTHEGAILGTAYCRRLGLDALGLVPRELGEEWRTNLWNTGRFTPFLYDYVIDFVNHTNSLQQVVLTEENSGARSPYFMVDGATAIFLPKCSHLTVRLLSPWRPRVQKTELWTESRQPREKWVEALIPYPSRTEYGDYFPRMEFVPGINPDHALSKECERDPFP